MIGSLSSSLSVPSAQAAFQSFCALFRAEATVWNVSPSIADVCLQMPSALQATSVAQKSRFRFSIPAAAMLKFPCASIVALVFNNPQDNGA
jgi:hypothetical protein